MSSRIETSLKEHGYDEALIRWFKGRIISLLFYIVKSAVLISAGIWTYHGIFHTPGKSDPTETHIAATDSVSYVAPDCVRMEDDLSELDKQAQDIITPLLEHFEGLRLKVYLDGGVETIGYGHHLTAGQYHIRQITRATADCFLQADLRKAFNFMDGVITVTLNAHQKAALSSWVYNVGTGAARHSSLVERLNQGEYDSVPHELMRWIHANGQVSENLRVRREREATLFTTQQ